MGEGLGPASVRRLLRMLAAVGAALVVVVIVSSAYLRLSQAGLSCADWPACYGNLSHIADATTAQLAARIAHRIAASAVGFVLIALLGVSLTQRPRLVKQAMIASLALAVATMLATVGAVMSESMQVTPVPAVTLANLLGGFALLALFVWLRETVRDGRIARSAHSLVVVVLITVIVQIVLGAFVSAKFAALACPAFPLCGADAPLSALRTTLDPFATLAVDATRTIVRPPALATLHWAHRAWAHVVLLLAAILIVVLARNGRGRGALLLALLVVLQVGLGAMAVLRGLPLGAVVAHNLVAAILLAALVAIACRTRSVSEVQPPVSEV
ncbi:MAG TPA: COX15/CtaA family protein [Casimicrobiaceae bacterium]|nr:COX15/CtaA family protein [Casimicrobiaceae bacterium]